MPLIAAGSSPFFPFFNYQLPLPSSVDSLPTTTSNDNNKPRKKPKNPGKTHGGIPSALMDSGGMYYLLRTTRNKNSRGKIPPQDTKNKTSRLESKSTALPVDSDGYQLVGWRVVEYVEQLRKVPLGPSSLPFNPSIHPLEPMRGEYHPTLGQQPSSRHDHVDSSFPFGSDWETEPSRRN